MDGCNGWQRTSNLTFKIIILFIIIMICFFFFYYYYIKQEYGLPSATTLSSNDNNIFLDDAGFNFVNKCIQTVESRGMYI